jgi:hypothetical protein
MTTHTNFLNAANFAMAATPLLAVVMIFVQYIAR